MIKCKHEYFNYYYMYKSFKHGWAIKKSNSLLRFFLNKVNVWVCKNNKQTSQGNVRNLSECNIVMNDLFITLSVVQCLSRPRANRYVPPSACFVYAAAALALPWPFSDCWREGSVIVNPQIHFISVLEIRRNNLDQSYEVIQNLTKFGIKSLWCDGRHFLTCLQCWWSIWTWWMERHKNRTEDFLFQFFISLSLRVVWVRSFFS